MRYGSWRRCRRWPKPPTSTSIVVIIPVWSASIRHNLIIGSNSRVRLSMAVIYRLGRTFVIVWWVPRPGLATGQWGPRGGAGGSSERKGKLSDQYPGLPPECQQSNYNGFWTIVHQEIKWENGFSLHFSRLVSYASSPLYAPLKSNENMSRD